MRASVGAETKSYGFALIVWGAGSLATARHGSPGELAVVAYVAGVFTAMAVMILVTFGGPTATRSTFSVNQYAVGAIHLGSVLGGLTVGWAISFIGPAAPAYLTTGFAATLTYQVLLCLEVGLSTKEPPAEEPDRGLALGPGRARSSGSTTAV